MTEFRALLLSVATEVSSHSLNKGKYISGQEKAWPCLFSGVSVVDMTKHRTRLMRAGDVLHPRVCRLSPEFQSNFLTASISWTTDGFLHFYMENFMVFLLYLIWNYRNKTGDKKNDWIDILTVNKTKLVFYRKPINVHICGLSVWLFFHSEHMHTKVWDLLVLLHLQASYICS